MAKIEDEFVWKVGENSGKQGKRRENKEEKRGVGGGKRRKEERRGERRGEKWKTGIKEGKKGEGCRKNDAIWSAQDHFLSGLLNLIPGQWEPWRSAGS